jgi:hypothetical protein
MSLVHRRPLGAALPLAKARAAHEMMAGERPRPRGEIALTPTAD